ncbi:four-carbon acid sugar kinase family protein [Mesorhizobium xinjiangense]|uniref:four-carbon acid sugar kinase family protein n=1 Tax=Mesorhizobium xinjiangense TaxID=2678685 RepID=UPI0012EE878B|nr:four-carbon acid sugar kinase family protein [Mesorhizobium xinjiangense]
MTDQLLLSYYGDDFTGSTDVMEALSSGGVPTVLFTGIPDEAQCARFADYRAIGVAGVSRSQSPEWMDENLPAVFDWLKALDARHCHYKVCSTFDSAPQQGSIGRALEVGLDRFHQQTAALVVGAPQLRRYTYFGQLFAAYRDRVYRIDRHPVMSRHPATPMQEADLLAHLAMQTGHATCLLDPEMLDGPSLSDALDGLVKRDVRCAMIDVYDWSSQHKAGLLLDRTDGALGRFVVGSSGVEYALLRVWKDAGLALGRERPQPLTPLERIAVVSGSCSSTTERQIDTACVDGFEGIEVDYQALISGQGVDAACERAFTEASAVLEAGKSPILYTARGAQTIAGTGQAPGDMAGRTLGRLLHALIERHALSRAVIAGGDTSSHALSELDIFALTLRHPIPESPGSPVCNAHQTTGRALELALKGGQIGRDDYFIRLRDGNDLYRQR